MLNDTAEFLMKVLGNNVNPSACWLTTDNAIHKNLNRVDNIAAPEG